MSSLIRVITVTFFLSLFQNTSFAQGQNVKIGLEIDSAHSVLFGVAIDSSGNRLVWHPKKSILLAGKPLDPTQWHQDSLGEHSTSFGVGNIPSGDFSMLWGYRNEIEKGSENNQITMFGFRNTASRNSGYSIIGGSENQCDGFQSFIYGAYNDVLGSKATVFGEYNNIQANQCTVSGVNNVLRGTNSTAIGAGLITKGSLTTVVGIGNDTTLQFDGNQTDGPPTPGTPLFVVGNGTSEQDRSNALSVFASGFVKIGSDTAMTDLHIKQSVHSNDVSSAGIRLENSFDKGYWQIYSSNDFLNFANNGVLMASLDIDGNYIDQANLFHEGDEALPHSKSINSTGLIKVKLKESVNKKGQKQLRIDSKSLDRYMPDLIKYSSDGKPHHLDENQLILHLLAKVQSHEVEMKALKQLLQKQEKIISELVEKE